jgi:hypothetical protein
LIEIQESNSFSVKIRLLTSAINAGDVGISLSVALVKKMGDVLLSLFHLAYPLSGQSSSGKIPKQQPGYSPISFLFVNGHGMSHFYQHSGERLNLISF